MVLYPSFVYVFSSSVCIFFWSVFGAFFYGAFCVYLFFGAFFLERPNSVWTIFLERFFGLILMICDQILTKSDQILFIYVKNSQMHVKKVQGRHKGPKEDQRQDQGGTK